MGKYRQVKTSALWGYAFPAAIIFATPAMAQGIDAAAPSLILPPGRPPPPPAPVDAALLPDDMVDFSADHLVYDDKADIVTTTGDVRMRRQGNRLRADKVTWNRTSGEVRAEGRVAAVNPGGDTAYGDSAVLKDSLKDGVIANMLVVLIDGGRLAAMSGTRKDGIDTLDHAAYSPCAVTDSKGCPKQPLWEIDAVTVVHNPTKKRVYYTDATLKAFGVPILWLPKLSHPDGSGGGETGFLIPHIRFNHVNGGEVELPYYIRFSSARDLTVTPHVYTNVLPAIELKYREINSLGAFQIGGMITYSAKSPINPDPNATDISKRAFRGYFYANGKYQLSPEWSITAAIRLTTDDTFMTRYNISNDDRLRSMINVERIGPSSYLSIAGWAVQTLRANDAQGQQPIALPAIDYRRRFEDLLGGVLEVDANSLAVLRTAGQDTQRAFASIRWDLRKLTPMGQQVTLTAYARGDIYHTDQIGQTATVSYRGKDGWQSRGIGALAIDVSWPFVGSLFGGTQRITPRVQIVASPHTPNLSIPNEDARAVDLEDSNLFALNRFPGYDRWEDGSRVTYGIEWAYDRPRLSIRSNIGQSYRFNKSSLFPSGTGLSSQTSDIVGRTTVEFDNLVSLTDRYRLDKDSLAFRSNEIDGTVGDRKTYLTVGYLRLNRNVTSAIEDLPNIEEVRLGARLQLTRYWSVFASTTIDLTNKHEDPTTLANGFEPIRHRAGIDYEDDCLEFGVTWKRDYVQIGDARRGNTFAITLALKNLGM
jgi:LPS-assembly protein